MRLLTFVAVAWAMVVPVPTTEVHAKPVGPPDTLAADRRVSRGEWVLSEFPIDFLAVMYDGDVHGGAVRLRTAGRWGPWVDLHDDGVEVNGHWASALVAGSDAEAYQVRVPAGARSPRAVVINTTDGPRQPIASADGCSDTTAVVTRCEWGADESLMTWAPEYYPAQKFTVHHTATSNGDTDPAATVRAIYRYQAVDRGFGDIGYQYLIDESGRVYEGRYSGTDSYPGHDANGVNVVTAAHVGGFNSGNTGIALLGTLTSLDPTPAAQDSLEHLLGELSVRHSIDPHGESQYVNPVNGVTKDVANISGHRDWAATECPGGTLYAQLPAIRDAAAGTSPPTDTTSPVIGAITASTKATSATLRWVTDEASTSLVEFRRRGTSSWTSSRDPTLTTSHTVMLRGLARRTTYDYRVTSTDAAGNTTTSAIQSFTTTK
jgi:N-acetylmuramoyl-L-alanine amidase/Purple acid Phosphatase, N-terminal domain